MMRLFVRRLALLVPLMTMASAFIAPARAQYPARPVRIIVPFPPGSGLDALTRIMADELGKAWGQGVVVENIAGGGGNVGTERFARAEPDGYTLLASPPGPLVFNRLLFRDTHFDAGAFALISLMAKVPNVLLVRKDFPAATAREFIDVVRARPGAFTFASQGVSSTGYFTAKSFETRTGASLVHVPYRGAGPALADLAAGHVDMFFDVITTSLPQHRGGAARILAVLDDQRADAAPEIPTMAESGLPGFRSISWFALAAPAGTPDAIADRINADVVAIIHRPEIEARLHGIFLTPVGNSRVAMASFLKQEQSDWKKLINDLGVEPQ